MYPDLGGLRMFRVTMLVPGFSSGDWWEKFGTIPASKNIEEWGEGKGVPMFSGIPSSVWGSMPL